MTRGLRAALGPSVALVLAISGASALAAVGRPGPDGSVRNHPASPQFTAVDGGSVAVATDASSATVAGRVTISAIALRLELVVPHRAPGRLPQVRATVSNLSAAPIAPVTLTLSSSPTLVVKPTGPRSLRNVRPGTSSSVTWFVCSTTGGTFQLVATATHAGIPTFSPPIAITLGASARC